MALIPLIIPRREGSTPSSGRLIGLEKRLSYNGKDVEDPLDDTESFNNMLTKQVACHGIFPKITCSGEWVPLGSVEPEWTEYALDASAGPTFV